MLGNLFIYLFICLFIYLFIYLFTYLLIFNLLIVEKFFSVTTTITVCKQQGLSRTPGAVNKITECWYR